MVHVDAIGGPGGPGLFGEPAGRGAEVAADLPVNPEQLLYAYVAGDGSLNNPGTNGGGNPGASNTVQIASGGGGASDLRTTPGDLSSRLLVAAGGGGAQICGTAGDAGQEGTSSCGCTDTPSMAGTATSGGAGGGGCGEGSGSDGAP